MSLYSGSVDKMKENELSEWTVSSPATVGKASMSVGNCGWSVNEKQSLIPRDKENRICNSLESGMNNKGSAINQKW